MQTYTIIKQSHSITAAPAGELIGYENNEFERDILAWTQPGTCVEIDLSAVSFIESMGIGFLIRLKGKIQGRGGCMVILNPQRAIASIFSQYRLDTIFDVRRGCPAPPHSYPCTGGTEHGFTGCQRLES